MLVLLGCDEASVRRAEAQDKLNPVLELAALSWQGDADATAHWPTGWKLRATNGQNKAARAIGHGLVSPLHTEYGALEAMAFEAEGLRSQIRNQARLASAYRGVAASPTKSMLPMPQRRKQPAQHKAEAYESARRNGVFARAR